jgi:hypothetical protein
MNKKITIPVFYVFEVLFAMDCRQCKLDCMDEVAADEEGETNPLLGDYDSTSKMTAEFGATGIQRASFQWRNYRGSSYSRAAGPAGPGRFGGARPGTTKKNKNYEFMSS